MADSRLFSLYGRSVRGDIMSDIQYKSSNGYTGVLYGKSSLVIYDPAGVVCLHTGRRGIDTYEELVDLVDNHPEFEAMLERLWEDRQCM